MADKADTCSSGSPLVNCSLHLPICSELPAEIQTEEPFLRSDWRSFGDKFRLLKMDGPGVVSLMVEVNGMAKDGEVNGIFLALFLGGSIAMVSVVLKPEPRTTVLAPLLPASNLRLISMTTEREPITNEQIT